MWSTAQRQKKIYRFHVHAGFEGNHRSDGYDKLFRWYGHVLRWEDGHVLRFALDFEVEVQRKKGRLRRMCKKQVEEESMKVGL